MKLEDILFELEIYTSNEEADILENIVGVQPIESYTERERVIIENLVRKSLITKVRHGDSYLVVKNEYC